MQFGLGREPREGTFPLLAAHAGVHACHRRFEVVWGHLDVLGELLLQPLEEFCRVRHAVHCDDSELTGAQRRAPRTLSLPRDHAVFEVSLAVVPQGAGECFGPVVKRLVHAHWAPKGFP